MKKVEAKRQTQFLTWVRKHPEYRNCAFELKIAHKGTFNPKQVEEHQYDALRAVKHASLAYKISDSAIGYHPFDCFTISGNAYVVVFFANKFVMFDVDELPKKPIKEADIDSSRLWTT